jgi:glycosyltransferase involved in cell wall biosynthesis
MSENLKISVITVCKNSENTISKCINSVLEQDYSNIEYIVIDGVSTDNSLKISREFENGIDKIISEPDEGIYDAMNKGIKNSSGDYIIFLNADDYFISNSTVANIIKFIEAEPGENIDVFYGKVFILDNDSNKGHIWKASRVSKYSLYRGSIPHPATVYSKKAFDKCGSFDISYKIAGDYEWVVRAYLKHQLIFKPFDMVISLFLKGGVSTDKVYKSLSMREKEKVRNIYFSASERQYYKFRWFFRKNFKIW